MCEWLQLWTTLAGKCLRMRPHFPSAKPRTVYETGRWFLCCPLCRQWCVSWFLAAVQWLAGSMIPLSRLQLGKICVSFQVPDTVQSLLSAVWSAAASCSAAVELRWDFAIVSGAVTNKPSISPWPRVLEGIRVALSRRLPSLLRRPACSFTARICGF